MLTGGAVAWSIWRASRSSATPGDVAMLYQAFQQGLRLMKSLLEEHGLNLEGRAGQITAIVAAGQFPTSASQSAVL